MSNKIRLGSMLAGLILISGAAFAKDKCETVVKAGLAKQPMAYDVKEIVIPKACKTFTLTLMNTNMAAFTKASMGHNLVISGEKKVQDIISKSSNPKLAPDYLDQKSGYLYATKMLGPNESDKLKISTAKLITAEKNDGNLAFYCTFPGHLMMKGKIILR